MIGLKKLSESPTDNKQRVNQFISSRAVKYCYIIGFKRKINSFAKIVSSTNFCIFSRGTMMKIG